VHGAVRHTAKFQICHNFQLMHIDNLLGIATENWWESTGIDCQNQLIIRKTCFQ